MTHSIRREVLTLTWANVDRQARVVRLEPGQTKNAEGRTLPYELLPELVELLDGQWQAHERLRRAGTLCPFVFPRGGAAIKDIRRAWTTACEAAGCRGKIPHDFRRTAVRNLVRAGVSERVAMQISGHKTRSVFDRYDIVNAADVRAAIGRLAAASSPVAESSPQVRRFRRRSGG